MSKKILHSALLRNPEFAGLVERFVAATGARVWVEDMNGDLLFGARIPDPARREPVAAFGEVFGYVSGCEKAPLFAEWLSQWAMQEAGRKKLGAEVLHLYREINLIFGFSEKLASVVGLEPIARLALEEAGRLIRFTQGAVLFKPNPEMAGRILAFSGSPLEQTIALDRLYAAGTSEIMDLGGDWAMFAALRVNDHIWGTMILIRGSQEGEFSAEDLKLLTSLALSSASAMEISIHYEEVTARALSMQREQLTLDLALRNPFFRKIINTINHHLADAAFGVQQLSKAMHLSPSQLQRKVLSLTDKTPLEIIRDLRMQRAKILLRDTDLTVAEVAFQSGFADPSYFTRIFKKEVGIPPSLWKETQNPA